MKPDESPDPLRTIAARYSALWQALSRDGDTPRADDDVRLLVDRVRDALDRRQARIENGDVTFIANSFLLEQLVHDGSTTQVHRIRHRDLGSLHAMKTLRSSEGDNVSARELLLREARLATTFNHGNILAPQILLRLPDGRPALISDWMPFTLSGRLNGDPLSIEDIRDAMAGMVSGLQAIHMAGLVHADIAPDNLLLKDRQLSGLKISDFGIALKRGQRHADLELARAGHAEFSAPEQVDGDVLDGRADLYSCGRILQLLMARCPVDDGATRQLSALARDLTAHDPGNRPQTAAAVSERLRDMDRSDPPSI
ncbi:protein kinase [Phyllobacterium sp. 0TCS1.6C]|uniref:protein kinase domain-containing protein n=1 Tax=unclassified Phyllobacterium TaxID=2638441 RepID=UPI0022655CFB|nr:MULTISPECIES: protein kinase [unclassified Phyllobacterium]MCX8280053.1 protein kinase [Phyllobacterium sp. 0TCS1.6C]MCX8294385.1 protein kinase [Phyllobacterium sp. 0TCS1.6A]